MSELPAPPIVDLERIRAVVAAARAAGRSSLLEPEGLAVLEAAGLAVPASRLVRRASEVTATLLAGLPGERVVVKVVAASIAHKTDVGGVAVVSREPAAVAAAIDRMAVATGGVAEGYSIAAFVPHDQGPAGELLLSLRWTDDFGPVVAIGAGGILTEALAADLRPGREIAIVSPSLTPRDGIAGAIAAATAVRLATGRLRGQAPRIPIERVVDAVERLLALASLVPGEISELEINPAAVTPDGLVALDILVNLGDGPRPARAPRPLHQVDRLLRPATIGIVGVSSGMNSGRVILRNILRDGFDPAAVTVIKPGAA
ncbi:MAG: acetate--CoA ligase family protein, partial [Chloroflexota bacterium]